MNKQTKIIWTCNRQYTCNIYTSLYTKCIVLNYGEYIADWLTGRLAASDIVQTSSNSLPRIGLCAVPWSCVTAMPHNSTLAAAPCAIFLSMKIRPWRHNHLLCFRCLKLKATIARVFPQQHAAEKNMRRMLGWCHGMMVLSWVCCVLLCWCCLFLYPGCAFAHK